MDILSLLLISSALASPNTAYTSHNPAKDKPAIVKKKSPPPVSDVRPDIQKPSKINRKAVIKRKNVKYHPVP